MAAVVKKVDYFYTTVPNKAGVGARIFNALKEEGVNRRPADTGTHRGNLAHGGR